MIFEHELNNEAQHGGVLPVQLLDTPSDDTYILNRMTVKGNDTQYSTTLPAAASQNTYKSFSQHENYNPNEEGIYKLPEDGDVELQRVEVEGHRLSWPEREYERWLYEIEFRDYFTDPRNDYQPDPVEGSVYFNNSCTLAQHTSPASGASPVEVALNDLRNAVSAAGDEINGQQNQSIEHSIVFKRTVSGAIARTPISHGTATEVTINIQLLPGEKIIAWIHSHPDVPGAVDNGWRPSNPNNTEDGDGGFSDQQMAQQMLNANQADPNAFMYILDGRSHDIFEYTMNGPMTDRPKGANISRDCN
ncbi:MAG: hypothetical protein K2P84_06455 [Undibacterium sp.]|nr:hypothetical protein [Gammaproteobacteria bacterium]MBY0573305.1 hypothetical protein [Undibacterium sp.]